MLSSILIVASVLTAQVPDTLKAANIVAERGYTVSRSDIISLDIYSETGEFLSGIPGLVVNDNGGAAALKSINFRGLGSAFTSIYVDGLKLCNLQSGQADISFLDLGDYSYASIDYAQNSLSFKSSRPEFGNGDFSVSSKLSYGSFGTVIPSVKLNFRLSDRIAMRASASSLLSKGDFSYGEGLIRKNNDIQRYNAGIDFWGELNGGKWHAKAYAARADRGIAGAVDWPSDDRQKDINALVQGSLEKKFSQLYSIMLSSKVALDQIDFISSWGNSSYRQREIQIGASHLFAISERLKASLGTGFQWDALSSDMYEASRSNLGLSGAAIYKNRGFAAELDIEYQAFFDKGHKGRNTLSPALQLKYSFNEWISVSGFTRRAFRTPTFNELYYKGYGNPELRPEDAWLNDVGIYMQKRSGRGWIYEMKLNVFHNRLKDKIVSAPTKDNPNIWLPYNIGSSSNKGLDAFLSSKYLSGRLGLVFSSSYSFQDSEVPYVNKHNLNLNAKAEAKGWEASLSWKLRAGRKDGSGALPDWNSFDALLSKTIKAGRSKIRLYMKAENILNKSYESVRGYPMPGLSLTGGIIYNFE